MAAESNTCPSCGARVPAESDRCELCGTAVGGGADTNDEAQEGSPDAAGGGDDTSREEDGVFCHQCGWENPAEARYCSQCGSELDDLSDAAGPGARPVQADLPRQSDSEADLPDPEADDAGAEGAMARQIALVVGGAFVLVLSLFFVTQWSNQQQWSDDASSDASPSANAGEGASSADGGGERPMGPSGRGASGGKLVDLQTLVEETADSVSGPLSEQIDSLRTRIGQASGAGQLDLRQELANLLIGAGQPGRAALVQREIADALGTVDARRREADLLYRWMQKLQQQGQRKRVFDVARHAAEAYAAVVEKRPNDLDARTRMGEAYLLTNEPMRGIQEINRVLEDDSSFVPAHFQKGIALLQINRIDQAVEHFEKVKRFAEKDAPFYRQADRALTIIEEQRAQAPSGGGASGARPE